MNLRTLLLIVYIGGSSLMAEDRVLFNFENLNAAAQWQSVNDGVLGDPDETVNVSQARGEVVTDMAGDLHRPMGHDAK